MKLVSKQHNSDEHKQCLIRQINQAAYKSLLAGR